MEDIITEDKLPISLGHITSFEIIDHPGLEGILGLLEEVIKRNTFPDEDHFEWHNPNRYSKPQRYRVTLKLEEVKKSKQQKKTENEVLDL